MIASVLASAVLLWAGAAAQNPNQGAWYSNGVVYQIYPRSFQDSDGDGIGDLKGILQRVDYLAELGIDAIWLNPIYPSPNKDFGYDISNMTAIDPVYGTMDDFEELVAALKNKSIKVIMDYVPNHTSDQHPWFQMSAQGHSDYKDYYVWIEPSSYDVPNNILHPPNNWTSCFNGSMWEYHPGRKAFYLHQFLKYQPDLNYRSPNVVQAMKDVLTFWLGKGVHGFRMDAVFALVENDSWRDEPYLGGPPTSYNSYNHTMTAEQPETFDKLRQFREVLDSYAYTHDNVTKIMMTESYNSDYEDIKEYYGTPTAPISTFPFNFFWITQGTLSTTASQWATIINNWYNQAMPAGGWAQANFVLGNHDQHRIASRLTPQHTDIMNILQLMLKGTAVVYFGDEIGLQDSQLRRDQGVDPVGLNSTSGEFLASSRDPERAPMPWNNTYNGGFTNNSRPWLPLATGYWDVNVEAQRMANVSHLQVFKSLMELRKNPTMVSRSVAVEAFGNSLVVYRELSDNPTFIAVVNLANLQQTVDLTQSRPTLPPTLEILVKTVSYQEIEIGTNSTSSVANSSNIVLPPLTGLVLKTF
uniref:alpha-glucosidase n=1 Tax=Lygus hesperus TaxID=30085 RepID=A0A0A9Y982_LYGHE